MGDKVGLQDIIDALAEKCGLSKQNAETFVKAMFDLIEESLDTEPYVKIKGLGTFKLTEVSNRESVNVNTGERFVIEGHSKISFTPDPVMRDLINKPFAHFETVVLNDNTVLEDTLLDDENIDEDSETEQTERKDFIVLSDQPEKETEKQDPAINNLDSGLVESNIEISEKEMLPEAENLPEKDEVDIPTTTTDSSDLQPPTPQNVCSVAGNGKNKRKWPYIVGVLLVTALLVVEVLYFMFGPEESKEIGMYLPESAEQEELPIQPNVEDWMYEQPIEQEKISESEQQEIDTVIPVKPIQPEIDTTKTIITGVRKGRNNVKPDSTSYAIVGTMTIYKLGAGETLTMVSKRFYETKDLWPYLVKHNRKVIKNPDQVPSGTTIRIPALRDRK